MERRIVEKSKNNQPFRQRLLADPRAAAEQELGTRLPEEVRVRVLEDSAGTIYLVLPCRSADVQAGELSDREPKAPGTMRVLAAFEDARSAYSRAIARAVG